MNILKLKIIKTLTITLSIIFFLIRNGYCNNLTQEKIFEIAYRVLPSESMATGTNRHLPSSDSQDFESQERSYQEYKVNQAKTKSKKQEFYEDSYYDSIPENEEINPEDVLQINTHINPPQRYEGHFKIGNPYKIFGISYIPQDYQFFEEEGMASWYGSDFHGKKTANGEIYNMGDITAAHPTLPLPSLIRVTNLMNGKTTVVRVNDRGPFAKNRIIDVSEKTAEILGFKGRGTTKVKIEFLRKETDEMLSKLGIGNKKFEIDLEQYKNQNKDLDVLVE
ncbi:hypothetical protein LBMAG18_12140 [Alphaproteobacteria bacterium]|nr:hypothetical protein LBMAG18_12140 [Alphaproteobacteria bacterium]